MSEAPFLNGTLVVARAVNTERFEFKDNSEE